MVEGVRRRLSYANVMATVAVFAALGGGAYAAKLGKGSVGPKQLKAKAVKTAKIANGAVTAPKLANGAVTAPKLAADSVIAGKVAAGAVGLSDTNPSLHQICPDATSYITGACIDDAATAANNWGEAFVACVDRGGRLPTIAELLLFRVRPGVTLAAPDEWGVEQSEVDPDDGTLGNDVVQAGVVDDGGSYEVVSAGISRPYRCVFNPVS